MKMLHIPVDGAQWHLALVAVEMTALALDHIHSVLEKVLLGCEHGRELGRVFAILWLAVVAGVDLLGSANRSHSRCDAEYRDGLVGVGRRQVWKLVAGPGDVGLTCR